MLEEESNVSGTSEPLATEVQHSAAGSRKSPNNQDTVLENMDVLLADLMQTSTADRSGVSNNASHNPAKPTNAVSYQSVPPLRASSQQEFQHLMGAGEDLFPGISGPRYPQPFQFDAADPQHQHLDPSLAGEGVDHR